MAVDVPAVESGAIAGEPAQASRLRWWRELLYILAFYGVYTVVRNTQGSAVAEGTRHALAHAKQIISAEKSLGIFHEERIQHWFVHVGAGGRVVGQTRFLEFWNLFYGTFHFIITAAVLIFLFRRFPGRYPKWRNTLACTTGLALIGFALYPLMPPRLIGEAGLHYRFIDTLDKIGSLWSFDSGTMQKLSNQYAAMPSLHFAWSSWCAFVMVPALKRPWTKAIFIAYPFITLFAIVVTANHYILDALGGVAVLGGGYLIGSLVTRLLGRLRPAPA